MKKLQSFKPSLVTKTFFPAYEDVSVINEGECFIWAYGAFLLFDGIELWYNWSHAFVKYRGRFYDSERLRGVESWQDLPTNKRGVGQPQRVSPTAFRQAWNHPGRYGTSWNKLEVKAKKVVKYHGSLLRA